MLLIVTTLSCLEIFIYFEVAVAFADNCGTIFTSGDELPKNLLGIIWKGKYRGQEQKWFVMKFLGQDSEINIKTKNPEFCEWKWIDLENITDLVVDFKLHVYEDIKKKVKEIIN